MDQDNYITLIYKKLKKELSPTEQKSLEGWTAAQPENAQLQQQIEENWQLSKKILPPISVDAKKDFQGFKKRMQAHKTANAPQEAIVRPINSWRRKLSIAAAIAIPLLAAWWIFQPSNVPMTLAQTSMGETKAIQLSDGTTINLNENSQLRYPTAFTGGKRQVELTGEAYFEVESDPNRPFEVMMEETKVRVLGTVFNIRHLAGEKETKVSVEEGKVELSSLTIDKSVILTKNEVGVYNSSTQQLTENKVNNKNASAWKSKILSYKSAPLQSIVTDLEQQFGIKTIITSENMNNCLVTARFTDTTPKKVYDYMVSLYRMELKEIDASTYELSKGVCK